MPEDTRWDRVTLRFADRRLESAFRTDFYRGSIGAVRIGIILGIALWAIWGVVIRQLGVDFAPFVVEGWDFDLVVRFGVLIPILIVTLALTYTPFAERIWETEAFIVLVLSSLIWDVYCTVLGDVPFDLGYVGVILIMSFSFTLLRLRFVVMAATGLALILGYLVVTVATTEVERSRFVVALFYLVSFYVVGMIAAYTLERFTRLLFLRERQLDDERSRSHALLLNVLPEPIAERLMARAEVGVDGPAARRSLAEDHAHVAVLFADLAGFTQQAGETPPDALVATLDDLFSEMDALAERHGLEKIKTVGDGYLAVAGVPTSVPEPAVRAIEMALDLVAAFEGRRWPSGDPVGVRVGLAAGPIVAGVIGRHKFAYDVWGDAVNLASRLQSAGQPGCILVAAAMAEQTSERFAFGPVEHIEIKGKGSQPARIVLGRAGA
jgi:class 3 adenylate cyclase